MSTGAFVTFDRGRITIGQDTSPKQFTMPHPSGGVVRFENPFAMPLTLTVDDVVHTINAGEVECFGVPSHEVSLSASLPDNAVLCSAELAFWIGYHLRHGRSA